MTSELFSYLDFLENKEFILWRLEKTDEQNEYWDTFIKENPSLEEEFQKAIEVFDHVKINKIEFSDTDLLYQRIEQSIANDHKPTHRIVYYLSAVAAVALIFIIGTFFFNDKSISVTNNYEEIIGKTLPNEDVKLLVGEDMFTLSQNSEIELSEEQMIYTDSTNVKKSVETKADQMNRLIVPNGKRSLLILADGSKVWINSGTELKFPSKFTKNTRDIYVDGEIYIDVSESKKQPFIVHTLLFDVEVFGTSFNLSAYSDDEDASVVLVDGSVKVQTLDNSLKMRPNEMVKLTAEGVCKEEVDISLYTSWTKGFLIFDDIPILEVLKKVGRYYNISFMETVKIPNKKITGKLYLSENIDDVLSSISLLTSTTYKIENNIVKLIDK